MTLDAIAAALLQRPVPNPTARSLWPWLVIGGGVAGGLYALTRPTPRHRTLGPLVDTVMLPHQPHPGAVGALLVVPEGFRPDAPWHMVLYYRGWNSCVEAVAGNTPATCRLGGEHHRGSHLVEQFDSVARGQHGWSPPQNAILVLPELPREENSGNAGRFNDPASVRAFLREVQAYLRLPTAPQKIDVVAHSGGYVAAAATLKATPVTGVALFDVPGQLVPTYVTAAQHGTNVRVLYGHDNREAARALAAALGVTGTLPVRLANGARVQIVPTNLGHSVIPEREFAETLAWLWGSARV